LLDNALGASRVLSSGTGPGEQAGYAIFIFLGIGPRPPWNRHDIRRQSVLLSHFRHWEQLGWSRNRLAC
jgi:hypothetical protein